MVFESWLNKINWESLWLQRGLRLLLAIGLSFFLVQLDLSYLEHLSLDYRVRLKPTSPISGRVKLISIDNNTVEEFQREPNAHDFIALLKTLGAAKPRAIVFTNNLTEVAGSYEDLETFAAVADRLPVYSLTDDLPTKGVENTIRMLPPLEKIRIGLGSETVDKVSFGRDGVTRRFLFSVDGQKSLPAQLASDINLLEDPSEYRGLFSFRNSLQGYIDFRPPGSYAMTSLKELLNGKNFNFRDWRDKIVIIGRDNGARTEDYVLTPFSRDALALSKLELQANIFDTLILNRAITKAPDWLDYAISFLVSLLTITVVLTLRPGTGLFLLVAVVAAFSLISLSLLAAFQFALAMAHPLLAVFVCYYFLIPYRLIMENRRSWEYYQRNQLLMQVEELKSNFLRMMSHDLKTPLARIQGMAEIVLKSGHPLAPEQTDALNTIRKSSEELAEFISSILNLGRIESKDIKLQLRSKDINTLLNEVIRKCEFLARSKGITIITEFEPLFSMRIDEDLMRQVFTNLVENAIKYSPDGSKIMVSTEEINGRVIVQIADQGIGIPAEELTSIFDKFFRSRTVVNGEIKGTGLGLYLSQYFVNLHKGKIAVESEPNRGSTFTVELPMELEA